LGGGGRGGTGLGQGGGAEQGPTRAWALRGLGNGGKGDLGDWANGADKRNAFPLADNRTPRGFCYPGGGWFGGLVWGEFR